MKLNQIPGVCINHFNQLILHLCRYFTRVQDKLIFVSFPDFSDNALALTEYLLSHPESHTYKIYWVVSNAKEYRRKYGHTGITFLSRKNKIGMMPISTIKAHLQSKYVFATHGFVIPQEEAKAGQKYILLWHGCGFKTKLGCHYTMFDKGLVPGPLFVGSKSKYWNVDPKKILAKGYPRYDWIFHPTEKARNFFHALKQDRDIVIFWLPTVRNSIFGREYPEGVISQFPIMTNNDDWATLDKTLEEANVLLVVKLHNSQKQYSIPFEQFKNIKVVNNQDFSNAGVKLYELFSYTDALITDYSSVSFDYLVTDKPIGYTLDDFKMYKSTRGFIFDNPLDYMPGHHIYNLQELKDFVEDIKNGKDDYAEKRRTVRAKAVAITDISYCELILKSLEVI